MVKRTLQPAAARQRCGFVVFIFLRDDLRAGEDAEILDIAEACAYPTARLGGSLKVRCVSIVLSVFRRVSRQAERRVRSRTG